MTRTATGAAPADSVTFFVPGTPAPQGSKTHKGHGRMVESSKAVEPWRAAVGWVGLRQKFHVQDGPVAVTVTFALKRPLRLVKGRVVPCTRPDIDKLLRAVLDALSGVTFRDDGQVVHVEAWKRYAEPGQPTGATITVVAL